MLIIHNVSKSYTPPIPALLDIDLTIVAGEIVCLLGPSGCGKTTLLRIVAGLEQPDHGEVHLNGENLLQIPVHRRNFGLMFQEFALFPHRTVGENVAFGLHMARWQPAQITQRVTEMLALVNLTGYAQRSIFELSGGERQRVALARSLAPNPRLLMLDEPLGSLDRALREELMNELRAILKRVGVTALYVTHDQEEAFVVADRLVVMNRGRIEQVGTPPVVYNRPANEFVAHFLGFTNLLSAQVRDGEVVTAVGRFSVSPDPVAPTSSEIKLLIRPQALLALTPATATVTSANVIQGKLGAVSFRGSHYRIELVAGAGEAVYPLVFDLPNPPKTAAAEVTLEQLMNKATELRVQIHCDPTQMTLLGGESPLIQSMGQEL
jgi:ABC-type Fe3+/spermidine/putrescine transport system ATPase subunit